MGALAADAAGLEEPGQVTVEQATPAAAVNTYVGYWPDAVDQTRTLVYSAHGCTGLVPGTLSQGFSSSGPVGHR